MERALLQQLTTSEIDLYLREVDSAIEAHIVWFSRVNRNLIFLTPPSDTDLAEHPEHLCSFGRWYQSVETPELRNDPAFAEIEEIHTNVHNSAKNLLIKLRAGNPISIDEYEAFVVHSNALRESARRLRTALKRNQGLVSRLMLKVFENASEGVIITDPRTHILQVNNAFSRVTGYRPDEVIGTPPVGTIMYVVCALGKISIGEFAREAWPFIEALIICLFIATYVPILSTWLPDPLMPLR